MTTDTLSALRRAIHDLGADELIVRGAIAKVTDPEEVRALAALLAGIRRERQQLLEREALIAARELAALHPPATPRAAPCFGALVGRHAAPLHENRRTHS